LASYNSNLPNVHVSWLDINYTAGLIRAATFGRGIWESELYTLVNVKENELNNSLSIFPNPAKDFLTLKVENPDNENLFYQLYDNSGKLLATKKLRGNEIRIDMSSLIPATYFLKVKDNNKDVKTFKIVKN